MTKIKSTYWIKRLVKDNAWYFAICAQDAGIPIGDFVKHKLVKRYGWSTTDKGFDEISKHCTIQITQEAKPFIDKTDNLLMTLREYYCDCIANGVDPLTGEVM